MINLHQQFGHQFLNGDLDALYAQFSVQLKNVIPKEQFDEVALYFNEQVTNYYRKYATKYEGLYYDIWFDQQNNKIISVKFDAQGQIQAIQLQLNHVYPETDQNWTRQTYGMPIDQDWTVLEGGPHSLLNAHYKDVTVRYAYDLVINNNDKTYIEDGSKIEHYFAFNMPVVAPAHGKVVEVVRDIPDNEIGQLNKANLYGNYIIVDHGHHEFSVVAHLKQYAVTVKKGDMVKRGQLLGYCGNSGDSTQPHIHFQLTDRPSVYDGKCLRINFANGVEPIQGNVVNSIKTYYEVF